MTNRNYDSSFLIMRKAQKAIAGSFLSQVDLHPYAARPARGMKDSSFITDVKLGAMTEYTRYNTCVGISAGCPCPSLNASLQHAPFNPDIPGLISGITFTVGSIIVSWTPPTTGLAPFSYIVTPYLNGVAMPSVTATNTTYRFTNLQELQPYTFTVCAYNAAGRGADVISTSFMSPPSILTTILAGAGLPTMNNESCVLYLLNAGIEKVIAYTVSVSMGPTIASRLMYLWVASVVQAWNWVSTDGLLTGMHDHWNWDLNPTHGSLNALSSCDAVIWLATAMDYITSHILPGTYTSLYTYSTADVARVQTAGQWDTWLSTWNTWYAYRLNDGSSSAITTMPTGSANWNTTIVVDGYTINDIAAFPQPQQWTRLTVAGKLQKYLTYGWKTVLSTCLSESDEATIQGSVSPVTGAARDAEIDDVLHLSQTLTDAQKAQAEFWAGSAPGTISPPLMSIWLWKEYVRSIQHVQGISCATLMYSLLDLVIHVFENGRMIWGLKALHMQDRPVQEIRRRYTGQQISSWNTTAGTTIDGSQWTPYQVSTFVTPPFPDFVSGHSGFMKGFSLTMNKWFGSTITKNSIVYHNLQWMSSVFSANTSGNNIVYGDFRIHSGTSTIEPGVAPLHRVTFSFHEWDDMATAAGMSRLYGGIHTIDAHTASQTVAVEVDAYINTTWALHPPNAFGNVYVPQVENDTLVPDLAAIDIGSL